MPTAYQQRRDVIDLRAEPRLRLRLLERFTLTFHGAPVELPPGSRRLLAYLAIQGVPCGRTSVAAALWPEAREARALGNLRSALWRLSRVAPGAVAAGRDSLCLGSEVALDLHDLRARAAGVLDGRGGEISDAVVSLLAHDLLPDWADEWIVVDREHVRQLRLHALEAICAELIATGRHGLACQAAAAAIRDDPLRETPRRLLISVHLAEGNTAQAVREYSAYTKLLREDLGVAPSERMASLIRPLKAVTLR